MLSLPEAAPATAGSNCTLIVAVCPGLSVTGSPDPDSANPVPLTPAPLIVSAALPLEVTVTVWVVVVFRFTLPNDRLLVFRLNAGCWVGAEASICMAKVSEDEPRTADSTVVCVVVTADTVAVKPAKVPAAPMNTDAGTVTAGSLLDNDTLTPFPGGPLR
jgi:hypothetical protein